MKLIDEKGKIFGVVNIIDLAVVLILVALIGGGALRMRKKPIVTNKTTKATITYEVPEVRMATIENLVEGDDLFHYDRGGYVGKIVEVSYEPFKEPLDKDGEWISAPIPGKYNALIKVEAEVNDNPDVITVGGEQTRVGIQYRMKNKRIAFFGTTMNIDLEELD